MRPPIVTVFFALLVAACAAVTPQPTASPTAPPSGASPSASPGTFVWEEYHSDNLVMSLQLPRGWSARRTGTAEGEILRASADGEGSLLVTLELREDEEIPFEQFVRESFRTILEEDPNAVQGFELPGGRAARATSPRDDGGVSVIYLFAPRGDHSKSLSFTWDRPVPNPIWHLIAERFNAYSPRPIIPFLSPSP